MAFLIVPFALVSVALIYVPVAMLAKGKLQERLSRGLMQNPWARLVLLLVVLGGLVWFVQWAVSKDTKAGWEFIVLCLTGCLVLLSLIANAPLPDETDDSTSDAEAEGKPLVEGPSGNEHTEEKPPSFWDLFWDRAASINAKSFVTALAAVLGAMSIGLWLV